MRRTLLFLILLVSIQFVGYAQEASVYWPKQMEIDGYVLTIYAPEPENFENNVLDARAAFSIFDKSHMPIFGAMWFQCFVHTDVKNNEVYFEDIQLVNASFPEAKAENIQELQKIISESSPNWSFNSNLSAFYKNINSIEINNATSEELINNPPKIIYSNEPAALVYIDGSPVLETVKNLPLYNYVVNTPHFIVQSLSDKQYYLKISNWWYVASDPKSSWKPIETPPATILQLASGASRTDPDPKSARAGRQPKLITTDEPAEIIQTMGSPEIAQGYENLFIISNSDDEILFDSYTDEYFILISGRWFKTRRLESGPWKFVAPDALPEVFSDIPPSSSLAHVRMSVAGTPEAMSAALNNTIPQTALVDRHSATMNVQYDGKPIFEGIDGTSLQYAVNTPASVLMDKDSVYYAVDQAIWFVSNSPEGPWTAAPDYPMEVKNIPPSCPLFNVKYVSIYDTSDDVVFAGYTSGYMGTFLYRGVVYYGTGYRYKSWHGSRYFPTPSTYGSGVKKKNTNVTVTVSVGYGYGYPGMMGYPGYGYGYGGYWGGYGYNSMFSKTETVSFNDDDPGEKPIDLVNIYNNRKLGIINTETVRRNDPMKPVILPPNSDTAPFHMFADSEGNLYRQDQDGTLYERKDNEWQMSDAVPSGN